MSATQAFADRWRRSGRSAVTLVQINLLAGVDPALTVYASHGLVSTPNGVWWEPLLDDVEPISAPGSLGTSDIPLCSTRVKLNLKRVSSQASGNIINLLHGRAVIGSSVTIYLWEIGLTNWSADALQVFKGVVQNYAVLASGAILNLRQRADWNRPMPTASLDPSKYPRAPEAGRGAPLPVIYGKVVGPGLRIPHTPEYSFTQRRLEMLRGPRALSRGVLADTGRGGTTKPKVLAAAHKTNSLFDATKGTAVWIDMQGKLVFVNAQIGDVVNTETESGILVADSQDAMVMVDVAEVFPGIANPARNPRYCLEPNDMTFSELIYDAPDIARDLKIRMASMNELGAFSEIIGVVCYEASSGTNLLFQAGIDGGGTTQVALGATSVPTLATLASVPSPGDWGSFSDHFARVYFGGVATGSYVKVYFLGILVAFFLQRKVVVAAHKIASTRLRPTFRESGRSGGLGWGPYASLDVVPETTELVGDFYWNAHGMGDGTPLVAGVPGALLEQAPHLYAHILGRFGSQQMGGHVEDGPTVFGSYTEAVNDMKTWTTRLMRFALSLSETTDVMTVLSWLAASSLSFIYIDRLTDRFHFIPWKLDRPVDWFFTFTPREVNELAPECSMSPDSSVVDGVRLRFGYNALDGNFEDEAALTSAYSTAGQKYVGLRDENLTVVAGVNDRINFFTDTALAVSLGAGTFTPGLLAKDAQVYLNEAPDSSREYYCSYAGVVTAGHNDRLVVNDGANKTITLDPGTYTMEALAAHAAIKLNAVSTLWAVSYSRTTGKFTFARSSGTAQLLFDNITQRPFMAAALFGFRPITVTGALSYLGDSFIEEERFLFAAQGTTIDLLWATGVDGSESATPRTAASLFGFDPRFNNGRGTLRIHVGICPKAGREATLATSRALYGPKRDSTYEARFIYDGETAREIRNRVVALYGKPRLRVLFTTEHAPDLERGRVIAFSGDFDSVLPYPEPGTNGSWVGKRFAVVETEQLLGPTSYSTRIVAVSL